MGLVETSHWEKETPTMTQQTRDGHTPAGPTHRETIIERVVKETEDKSAVTFPKLLIQFGPTVAVLIITVGVGLYDVGWLHPVTDFVGWVMRGFQSVDPSELPLRTNGALVGLMVFVVALHLFGAATFSQDNQVLGIIWRIVTGFAFVPWVILMWEHKAHGKVWSVGQSVLMSEIGFFMIFLWVGVGYTVVAVALTKTLRTN